MSQELTAAPKTGIVASHPPSMLEMVMQAASRPDLDPARLREFLDIARQLEADGAKKEYNQAWAAMSPHLPMITKHGRIEYKPGTRPTQFAKWDDIHPACMPILNQFGFAVSFDSSTVENRLTVVVVIMHTGGHEERRSFTVPAQDTGGSKGPAQAAASSFTMAQRHAFCKAFNILTIGEDDDATGKGQSQITEAQALQIEDVIQACDDRDAGSKVRFLKWLKTEFQTDKPSALFDFQLPAVTKALDALQKRLGMLK